MQRVLHKSYSIIIWRDGLITGNNKWVHEKGHCQKCHEEDFLYLVKWPNIRPSYECRWCIERHLLRIGLEGQTLWANMSISKLPKWIVEKLTRIDGVSDEH